MSRVQVCLAPTEYDDAQPVWADVVAYEDGTLAVRLPPVYPYPTVGWWLAYNGRDYEVTRADGNVLFCTLKGG